MHVSIRPLVNSLVFYDDMVKSVKYRNIPPLYFSLLVVVGFMCSDHEAIPCHAHYILSIFPFFIAASVLDGGSSLEGTD